jgi:hypothetical protein
VRLSATCVEKVKGVGRNEHEVAAQRTELREVVEEHSFLIRRAGRDEEVVTIASAVGREEDLRKAGGS